MKKNLLLAAFAISCSFLYSQPMHVKDPNFTSFRQDAKKVPPLLDQKSSIAAKQHPEYGVLPFNAQCSECVELIDKRTLSSRFFIDPKDAGHTYSQQSYFPLHYKYSVDDIWRTIDHRLRPDATQAGVYTAVNQPVPTKCDLNKNTVTLNTGDLQFEFNKNLAMYFFDENTAYTKRETGDYSLRTIGEEGLLVKNIWPGVDLQQVFRAGEIETNYVINKPLQLPITKGWMVIEDHFTLPAGFTFEEAPNGEHVAHEEDTYYKGDYILRNAKGDSVIVYEKPLYVDAMAFGMHGNYKLLRTGNDYTLQMFVPVDWLGKADNTYPLYIDPTVYGITKLGNFRANPSDDYKGGPSGALGFTSIALGSCDYQMQVEVPGASRLTNAYVDIEYELTYDNTCGSPPEPAPYCTFSQVIQQVVCNTCGTSSGPLSCIPPNPPFTGTCTTNDSLVPGAHSILINTANPNFLSCIPPQCATYNITFTLKNQDSICTDVCGYLCARGNIWQMTVEGNALVSGDTTYVSVNAATGYPVTLVTPVSPFVPPYYCVWQYEYQNYSQVSFITDTIYNNDSLTFTPPQSGYITCGIYSPLYNDTPYCSFSAEVKLTTGLPELHAKPLVDIYPNPASTELVISANNFQPQWLTVYDLNGRRIAQQKFVQKLDISKLSAGAYFIEIRGADASVTKRFVKLTE